MKCDFVRNIFLHVLVLRTLVLWKFLVGKRWVKVGFIFGRLVYSHFLNNLKKVHEIDWYEVTCFPWYKFIIFEKKYKIISDKNRPLSKWSLQMSSITASFYICKTLFKKLKFPLIQPKKRKQIQKKSLKVQDIYQGTFLLKYSIWNFRIKHYRIQLSWTVSGLENILQVWISFFF